MPRRAPIVATKLEPPTVPRPRTTHAEKMEYRIGRGEQGVLTFEPYKSYLLPLWRFRTPEIARQSSALLRTEFEKFGEERDFVGMDMARKFIQMGFTRAKRYANHKGGKKYDKDREVLPNSEDHSDKADKEEASRIFKTILQEIKKDVRYLRMKDHFQAELKDHLKQVAKNT
ncbi:hypothetical protein E4T50_10851 [Aureobasidium sp. EXF-12298]|nr:hypothetical protein E4T50_10851 [Aureobasidium sp. EXF-12298]